MGSRATTRGGNLFAIITNIRQWPRAHHREVPGSPRGFWVAGAHARVFSEILKIEEGRRLEKKRRGTQARVEALAERLQNKALNPC